MDCSPCVQHCSIHFTQRELFQWEHIVIDCPVLPSLSAGEARVEHNAFGSRCPGLSRRQATLLPVPRTAKVHARQLLAESPGRPAQSLAQRSSSVACRCSRLALAIVQHEGSGAPTTLPTAAANKPPHPPSTRLLPPGSTFGCTSAAAGALSSTGLAVIAVSAVGCVLDDGESYDGVPDMMRAASTSTLTLGPQRQHTPHHGAAANRCCRDDEDILWWLRHRHV